MSTARRSDPASAAQAGSERTTLLPLTDLDPDRLALATRCVRAGIVHSAGTHP